jgi:hypothetical protein
MLLRTEPDKHALMLPARCLTFVSTMITCLGVPDVLADMGLRLGPEDIAGLELAERFTDRRILSFVTIGIESPHLGGA